MKYEITGKCLIVASFRKEGLSITINSEHTYCEKAKITEPIWQKETMTLNVSTEIEAGSEEDAIEILKEELQKKGIWSISLYAENNLESINPANVELVCLDVKTYELELTDEELKEIEIDEKVARAMEEG